MNNGFSLNLVQSAQPYIPFYKKIIMIFDLLQQKYSKTSLICPKELLTSNRKDIEYRIQFLKEVLEKKTLPKNTLYYQYLLLQY